MKNEKYKLLLCHGTIFESLGYRKSSLSIRVARRFFCLMQITTFLKQAFKNLNEDFYSE